MEGRQHPRQWTTEWMTEWERRTTCKKPHFLKQQRQFIMVGADREMEWRLLFAPWKLTWIWVAARTIHLPASVRPTWFYSGLVRMFKVICALNGCLCSLFVCLLFAHHHHLDKSIQQNECGPCMPAWACMLLSFLLMPTNQPARWVHPTQRATKQTPSKQLAKVSRTMFEWPLSLARSCYLNKTTRTQLMLFKITWWVGWLRWGMYLFDGPQGHLTRFLRKTLFYPSSFFACSSRVKQLWWMYHNDRAWSVYVMNVRLLDQMERRAPDHSIYWTTRLARERARRIEIAWFNLGPRKEEEKKIFSWYVP